MAEPSGALAITPTSTVIVVSTSTVLSISTVLPSSSSSQTSASTFTNPALLVSAAPQISESAVPTPESRLANGLHTIDIVAIVIGVLVFLCGLGLGLFIFRKKRSTARGTYQAPPSKDWDSDAFVTSKEKDPYARANWQDDLERQYDHQDEPSSATTMTHDSKYDSGIPDAVAGNKRSSEYHIPLPIIGTPPNHGMSPNSRASLGKLSPITIPEYHPPQTKRLSSSRQSPIETPPLSRQNSSDDLVSEYSASIYSQPSAMLSRGPSTASRMSRSHSRRVATEVPPVPSLPDYLKHQEQRVELPTQTMNEEDSRVPSPPPSRKAAESNSGPERQSTIVISQLLLSRNRRSQSPPDSDRSSSPIEQIERAGSIKPAVEGPQIKEPYGRRVRRMRQELSSTQMSESRRENSNADWENVPLESAT